MVFYPLQPAEEAELEEKTVRPTEFRPFACQAPIATKEFKVMFSHRPRAGYAGWVGKLGTSLFFQLAFGDSFTFKTIQWDCVICESRLQIQLTPSS